ncbi:Kelch-like protein 17 [Acipenser ruthenus]|uniref:Kelch-like protein 17 n=1 Tax=Acipenser ruthenus TaxID=7906 RepID=A0A444UIP2_ACIRT|nr:Kelch-like protein 17 [Acipenser ruthenus]
MWSPKRWRDQEYAPSEALSDSDSEEEDFPDESSKSLGDYITQGLKQLLNAQQLCDVTLAVEGKKFMCHRVLLASVSPYFRAMFTSPLAESRLAEIRLEEVTPEVVQTVVHFIYTGEAGLNPDTAEDLFKDFLLLDPGTLGSLLSSDRLGVESELEVYRAARRWAQHQPRQRNQHLPALLSHLRPGLLAEEELRKVREELGGGRGVLEGGGGAGSGTPPRPREGMFEKKIVCIDLKPRGDHELSGPGFAVDCFDPRTGRWEKLADLKSVTGPGCAAVGDRLFVAGGVQGSGVVSDTLHEYDPVADHWTERPPMAVPRVMHGFLGACGKLYALGGCNRASFLDSVEVYDLQANTWARSPPPGSRMPLPLRSFAAASLRGKLYLLGGTTVEESRAAVHHGVLIYNTALDHWARVHLETGATFCAGGVAVRGGVCAVGGYCRDASKFTDGNHTRLEPMDATGRVLFFREGRGSSREVVGVGQGAAAGPVVFPGLPRRIAAGGVARWKRRIYMLGGENGARFYDSVYCWKPGWRSWVQRREKLPLETGGVSQFGCTTLKFPKKHILSRLRAFEEEGDSD